MSHALQGHLWMFTSSGEKKTQTKTKTNKRASEINQGRQVWRNTGQNTNTLNSSSELWEGVQKGCDSYKISIRTSSGFYLNHSIF